MTTGDPDDRKGLCLTVHRGQRVEFNNGMYIYLKCGTVKNLEMIIVAPKEVVITRTKEYGAHAIDRETYEAHLIERRERHQNILRGKSRDNG